MSDRKNNLSADAETLLADLRSGMVLWFSDAGEYPDRFWLESDEDEGEQTGQVVNVKAVSELQAQGMIEPDEGDSYRRRWRLISPD